MPGGPVPSADTWQSVLARALAEILDLLNPTTWLPALMLLANAYLLTQIPSEGEAGIGAWLSDLDFEPPGFIGIVLLLLTALLIQSVQFQLLQVLQGYWGRSWIGSKVAIVMIHLQERRFRRDDQRRQRLTLEAFRAGRARLEKGPVDSTVLDIMEAKIRDLPPPAATDRQFAVAESYGWRMVCEPSALRRIEELERVGSQRPLSHRLLPTRLGNVLRSAEDRAVLSSVSTKLLSTFDGLPPSLMEQHDRFRRRMDMWCSLAAIFALLAVAAGALLVVYQNESAVRLSLVAVYLVAALISYRASVYEAEGYGSVLIAIDQALISTRARSVPDASGD